MYVQILVSAHSLISSLEGRSYLSSSWDRETVAASDETHLPRVFVDNLP